MPTMSSRSACFLALLLIIKGGVSFEFPKIPVAFGGISLLGKPKPLPTLDATLSAKKALFQAVSGTSNGKTATPEQQLKVLQIVRSLEKMAPAPSDILTNAEQAQKIDGVWYLQYTSPSNVGDEDQFPDAWKPVNIKEGDSRIDDRPFAKGSGAVSAVGIKVDTSNRVVQQIFDVSKSRVRNEIDLGWGKVEVEGSFRSSSTVPYRAIVGFDRADIFLDVGPKLQLGWVFDMISLLKGGSRDNGWIETTFIDNEMRIARGNKGTLFVLTRDVDAVTP